MITSTVCEIVWFAGLVAWYIIRYPFERRAKKVGVTKSLFGWRESGLLSLAFFGLWIVPAYLCLDRISSCSRSSAYSGDCDSRRRRVVRSLVVVLPQPCGPWQKLVNLIADSQRTSAGHDRHLSVRSASDVFVVFPFSRRATDAAAELVCRRNRTDRRRNALCVQDSAGRANDDGALWRRVQGLHGAHGATDSLAGLELDDDRRHSRSIARAHAADQANQLTESQVTSLTTWKRMVTGMASPSDRRSDHSRHNCGAAWQFRLAARRSAAPQSRCAAPSPGSSLRPR